VKRANEGCKAFDDRALAAYGWNIQDAIRFALEHLARQGASVPVTDAASALVAVKAASGRSARYCRDLRLRLGRLCAAFDGRIIAH
jgi:hypothetical protein